MAFVAFLPSHPGRFSLTRANRMDRSCPSSACGWRAIPSLSAHPRNSRMSRRVEPPAPAESRSSGGHPLPSAIAAFATVAAVLPPSEAAAISAATAVAGPLFAPLNADTPELLRTLVWADFRIAVALFVISPLAIFIWSILDSESETDAVLRTMSGYWQSSSLLLLTVFLNIANVSVASFTGLFVQCLIPVTLVWWKDLSAEISRDDSALARAYRAWRGPAIGAALAGVLVQIPFQGCNASVNPRADPICSAWLEPPYRFHELLLSGVSSDTLLGLAAVGGFIYAAYLLWLTTVVLPRVGREGRKDRNCFSSVSALKQIGLIRNDSQGN